MFELLLVRHGQTDWNIERRVMGTKPVPLNVLGRSQARQMAKGLKNVPIHAIYTSPLRRALQTAQLILKGRDSVPLVEEEGLNEINYGDWVGRLFSDVPELSTYFNKPTTVTIPNGEALADVQRRAIAAIDKMREKHTEQRVLGISHADVIKLILIHYLRMTIDDMQKFRIDNGSLSVIRFDGGDVSTPRVISVNCHCEWKKYCNL